MDMSAAARRRRRRRVADENRKRAPRACTRCKARKSRCIEIERGACQRCRLKSLSCIFEREMSPTGPDASVLSSTASPTVSRTTAERPDQDEDVTRATDEPTRSSPPVTATGVAEPSPAESFSGDGHPSERFMWPRFLSKLRETFSLDSCGTATAGVNQTARPPPTLSPPDLQRLRKAADAFPPRPVADFLLSVCIEHGTDSFYYFDQVRFLAEIDQFYTDPSSRLRYDISFICLAYAAFALGSQWTALARPDGRKPLPILQEDNDPGRIFYYQARALVPDVIDLPCLRAVQATFVLGVYLLPASSIGSAYLYLGLSLRKALAMDLHLNADEVGIMDDEEKEVRRRIWWAVYSLERSTTIKLNRPRTVNPAIITVSLPQVNPALDDNQKFNNIEHQIADARLMLILDRVSEPSEWTDAQTAPGRFGDELKQWKRSLPASLKLVNVHPKASAFRATFHLYLNYYFAWIAMGKVSVVSVVRARLRHAFASASSPSSVGYTLQQGQQQPQRSSSTQSTPPHVEEHTDNMSRSCIKAARKMLNLFEELSRTGNLTRFSFTDFQGCSIATIVILLAGIVEHDDPSFERQADFGLNCLRRMAEGGNSAAKTGVGFVEALRCITEEAKEKLKKISSLAALSVNYQSSDVRSSTDASAGGAAAADMSQAFLQQQHQTSALSQEHYNGWVEWLSRQPAHQFSVSQQMMTPLGSGIALFPPSSQQQQQQQQQQHVHHLPGNNQQTLGPPPGLSGSGDVMASLVGSRSSDVTAASAAAVMSANNASPWQAGGGEILSHDTHDRGTNHGHSPHELRRFSRWDGAAALQQLSAPVGSSLVPSSGDGGGGGGVGGVGGVGGGGGVGGAEAAPVALGVSGGNAMQQHQRHHHQQHQQQQHQQQQQQHSHHQQLTLQQQQQYQQALHGQHIMVGNGMPGNGGGNMFSTLYADEQAFLMGLTGWDVLGVSELYEQ